VTGLACKKPAFENVYITRFFFLYFPRQVVPLFCCDIQLILYIKIASFTRSKSSSNRLQTPDWGEHHRVKISIFVTQIVSPFPLLLLRLTKIMISYIEQMIRRTYRIQWKSWHLSLCWKAWLLIPLLEVHGLAYSFVGRVEAVELI
jgi:hypothetical protein